MRVSGLLYGGRASAGLTTVFVQVRLERELASAARALVVLSGRMRLDVSSKVGSVSKRFAAVSAAERLFSRVRALVTSQQPRT